MMRGALEVARILIVACVVVTPAAFARDAADATPASMSLAAPARYFTIQVVDRQTGRGVPLVELRTTNNIRYVTDSNGIVAFCEPGLMDRDVFFFVESQGYTFPKDGFGMAGRALRTTPGTEAHLEIDRVNVAERLYRVTGQGIYRDSVLTGRPVPLRHPVLDGQVTGQDSVYACIYRDRLFWLWGDTNRPSYPLGNFATSGAVSDLPGQGGLDPAVGVNLEYFVNEEGFSRPMAPLKEPGLVWLDGLLTVKDNDGQERMVAHYARLKGLGDVRERGLMVFNDATERFEPAVRSEPDFFPYASVGHVLRVSAGGKEYCYFATPFPLAVRMRVQARWDDVLDPNRYEVLTALGEGPREPCRWVTFAELTGTGGSKKASVIEALQREKKNTHLYEIESGKRVIPHGGSVYFNAYRQRWIMIFVEQGGTGSYLGEVWYAEADTPVGPWAYARKVATHKDYSFYNPKQHPYFDQDGGRAIFFEGTYSFTFSGSLETATPRYDYNQIMYRLNLDGPRMVLPVAVYRMREGRYSLRDGVEQADGWKAVESIPFFAVEPDRAGEGLVAVYAQEVRADKGRTARLATERPTPSAEPLFYALPTAAADDNPCVVCLYEYRDAESARYRYSTEEELDEEGWKRADEPLCRVWKAPVGRLMLDTDAVPPEETEPGSSAARPTAGAK